MPPLHGVIETALYVADPDRTGAFYRRLFGFPELFRDPRLIALQASERQVLLLFRVGASDQDNPVPGGVIPPHDATGRQHLAFGFDADDAPQWVERLREQGVDLLSTVHPPRGGVSLYFRDPDGHLLELVSRGTWPCW